MAKAKSFLDTLQTNSVVMSKSMGLIHPSLHIVNTLEVGYTTYKLSLSKHNDLRSKCIIITYHYLSQYIKCKKASQHYAHARQRNLSDEPVLT